MNALVMLIALGSSLADAPPEAKPAEAQRSLTEAYKREFSFLEAEKSELKRRLAKLKKRNAGRAGTLKAKIRSLQDATASAEAETERLEETLRKSERVANKSSDDEELLLDALSRARTSLQAAGFDPGETPESFEARVAHIAPTFDKAVSWIKRASTVRVEPGGFFLESGDKVQGQLIHFGQIATWGVAGDSAGALAPAGGGHLWLWPEASAADSARALAEGTSPKTLDLFLYETLDKRVDRPEVTTWRDTVESGGIIAWVIVYLGLVGLGLVALRSLILLWLGLGGNLTLRRVQKCLADNDLGRARQTVRRARTSAARLARAALGSASKEDEQRERRVTEQLLREVPRLEWLGSLITVVAAVAPLLGLLGTVTGMISTFDIITEHGTGDPKLLSGGISEALITTELGLIVAIPTLLLGTLVSSRANAIIANLERASLSLLNQLDDCDPPTLTSAPAPEAQRREAAA